MERANASKKCSAVVAVCLVVLLGNYVIKKNVHSHPCLSLNGRLLVIISCGDHLPSILVRVMTSLLKIHTP